MKKTLRNILGIGAREASVAVAAHEVIIPEKADVQPPFFTGRVPLIYALEGYALENRKPAKYGGQKNIRPIEEVVRQARVIVPNLIQSTEEVKRGNSWMKADVAYWSRCLWGVIHSADPKYRNLVEFTLGGV